MTDYTKPPEPAKKTHGCSWGWFLAILIGFAALITPSMSHVFRSARITGAYSNTLQGGKRLALAFHMYTEDNDGCLPMANNWAKAVDEYEVWLCHGMIHSRGER